MALAAVAPSAAKIITTSAIGGAFAGAGFEVLAKGGRTGLVRLTAAALKHLPDLSHGGQIALTASEVSFHTANSGTSVVKVAVEASEASFVTGVEGAVAGGAAGARAGEKVVETAGSTLAVASKVATGVGGGLAVVVGIVEAASAISTLVNGSTTWQHVKELEENITAGLSSHNWPVPAQEKAAQQALRDATTLAEDVSSYDVGINSSRTTGGIVGVAGGGLTIAGVFFPPLLIPGLIIGGVAAATSVTNLVIEMCQSHHDRYIAICAGLKKQGIYVIVIDP